MTTNGNGSMGAVSNAAALFIAIAALAYSFIDDSGSNLADAKRELRTEISAVKQDSDAARADLQELLLDALQTRYSDNRHDIDLLVAELKALIRDEQQRNNSIESRLAAEEKVTELWVNDKLKTNGATK